MLPGVFYPKPQGLETSWNGRFHGGARDAPCGPSPWAVSCTRGLLESRRGSIPGSVFLGVADAHGGPELPRVAFDLGEVGPGDRTASRGGAGPAFHPLIGGRVTPGRPGGAEAGGDHA